MVDFIRNNIDRIMKLENDKVGRLNKSNTVNKVSDQNRDGHNFRDELKKKKRDNDHRKYKRDNRDEKELLESNIVIDSSLNRELEKNRRISALVKEKFVDNSNINNKIHFEGERDDESKQNSIIEKILYKK